MSELALIPAAVPLPGRARLVRYGKIIAATAVLTYGFCLFLVYSIQNYAIFPGQLLRSFAPAFVAAPGVQAISFETADGEHLFGYYSPPKPGGGIVVTFHGNGGFPEHHAVRFQNASWAGRGWGFLCVTYRGYSRSSGQPSEAAALRDGDAVVAYAQAQAPGAPILFHGHSLGAAVATAMAARHPNIGLYLEAPFVSMQAMARTRFPIFPTDQLLHDTFRSDLRIPAVTSPIVIVHGRDDSIVPFASGEALAAATGGRARFVALPGEHMEIFGKDDGEAEPFFRDRVKAALAR